MGKKEIKTGDRQTSKDPNQKSRNVEEGRDEQISLDRSARHLSGIDRREGEMNHGETGGNFRHPDEPDNRA